jgi:hypothetical protein
MRTIVTRRRMGIGGGASSLACAGAAGRNGARRMKSNGHDAVARGAVAGNIPHADRHNIGTAIAVAAST